MPTPKLKPCWVCGKNPTVANFADRRGEVEYVCEIECKGHAKEVGTSLDNAIEAQREAEEKWNRRAGEE